MDATRYLEMEMLNIGKTEPKPKKPDLFGGRNFGGGGYGGGGGWMS
jgi:hypothetical protein